MVIDTSTAGMLFILSNVLLPIVVAFVTKHDLAGKYKAVVLLALSGVSSVVYAAYEAAQASASFDWPNAILGAVVAFVIATATHYGLWKPAEITGSEGKVAKYGLGG